MLEIFLALESYKYLALFAGVLVGGEWVLIPVMYLVFSGVFSAEAVIIITLAASLSADSIWYGVGRILSHYGSSWWQRKPFLRQAGQRAKDLLERHGKRLVVIVKFIYGPRTLIHIAFGIIRLPYAMYMLLNAIGTTLWVALIYLVAKVSSGLLPAEFVARRVEFIFAAFALSVIALYILIGMAIRKLYDKEKTSPHH